MPTSSAYHFFAHLVARRDGLIEVNKLADFDFPSEIIADDPGWEFPDFILKTNDDGEFTGGEFIELKDAKAFSIASFNSTIPTATKPISTLSRKALARLSVKDKCPEQVPVRDVYYLIRGIRVENGRRLCKTVLVGGAFFQTLSVSDVLTDAFSQVATDSAASKANIDELTENLVIEQHNFAAMRHVSGSGFSVRFRVMAEAGPATNLLSSNQYPAIGDNSLTFLTHEADLPPNAITTELFPWSEAENIVKSTRGYSLLALALDEIDPRLKSDLKVSILRHPLNGPFFMAQAPIHPS